jgi:hypothetical protein
VRRILMWLTAAAGLAAVGCGGDAQTVSPTAPKFQQPNVKPAGKPAGVG